MDITKNHLGYLIKYNSVLLYNITPNRLFIYGYVLNIYLSKCDSLKFLSYPEYTLKIVSTTANVLLLYWW